MIIHVANPIYDSVFKYIMEDERIAKTILSALLKKEVVHVTVRPHEYSNTTRDTLSMFRIDFAATVREKEGNEIKDRIVLIELQKTWLNTETLRFRQYLGAQYNNKNNIREADEKGFAYPMVAVYLLGHKVGNIKEPIVYVNHDVFDYNGNVVAEGNAEPFVESLTHNSIIVQIPRLQGNVNNRLEKVLSVFDQTNVEGDTQQVLKIDEDKYADDNDMMYVLHKLTAAAANSEMRQDMNVEDEFYKAIEDRDTAIMQRDKILKEQSEQISQQSEQISQQSEQISQQSEQISQQSEQLSQQSEQISQQSEQLKNMAKALSASGQSNEQISQMTGMSVAEIAHLLE
jgi:methyl-accepting chemotaxis protein